MARQGLVWGPSSRLFGRMDPRLLWKALMRIQLGGRTWAIYRDQSLLKKPCSASWIWFSHCGQANKWGSPTGHPHRAIVEDAKLLLTYTGVSPSHIYCFAWQFGKSMSRQLGKEWSGAGSRLGDHGQRSASNKLLNHWGFPWCWEKSCLRGTEYWTDVPQFMLLVMLLDLYCSTLSQV